MPAPPFSSGISMPIKPIPPIFLIVSYGNSPLSSNSAAIGTISFCAKSRAASRIILCSALRENNTDSDIKPPGAPLGRLYLPTVHGTALQLSDKINQKYLPSYSSDTNRYPPMNTTPTTEDRIWAIISHLSSLALGMGIVLPIVGWLDQRRKSNYAAFQS